MYCALPLPVPASSLHPTASVLKTSDCCPTVICTQSLQSLCYCTPYFIPNTHDMFAIGQGAEHARPSDMAALMLRLAETKVVDIEATEQELRFVIESATDLEDLNLKSRSELELAP